MKRKIPSLAHLPLRRLALLCCLSLSGGAETAFAQQAARSSQKPEQIVTFIAPPAFPASAPDVQRLIVEDSYFYQVRTFTPAVKVKPVTRAAASYGTPEDAAIARISALVAGDFAWFRSGWTQQAQIVLDEQDKLTNQTPEFWKNLWAKIFTGRQVELTHRIETGEYMLIAYRVLGAGKDGKDVELIDALKKVDGQWLGTQEISRDPVLNYWRTPETPIKRIIRMAPGVTVESAPRQ